MPITEDIQKRSRTIDRTFIRTPVRVKTLSFSRNNSARTQKSDFIGNPVVSHSSISISSIKPVDWKRSYNIRNKNNILDSQISLDYTPKQATFDSDNSSIDENGIRDCEDINRLPDSGSFWISGHSMRDHSNRDRTPCSISSTDIHHQRLSSPINLEHLQRSSTLSNKNKFKITNKSIDESSDSLDRSLQLDLHMESLSEIRTTPNSQSFSSEKSILPQITRCSNNMNAAKIDVCRKNGFISLLPLKSDLNTFCAKIDNEQEGGDLEIKLKSDRSKRFGFTIINCGGHGSPVIIESIEKNMPADTCFPRLNEGDQLVSINGEDVDQFYQDEIVDMIKRFSEIGNGEIVLNVKPRNYMADHTIESLFGETRRNKILLDHQASMLNLRVNKEIKKDLLGDSIKIIERSIDSNSIHQQFETMYRKKPGFTMVEAKKIENATKNRYRDISPYDQTRVMLMSNNNSSDYINASLITMDITDNIINRYIAAQGPLPNTSADFWLMCWEQQIHLIVMLTTLSEQGRPKCHKYWPPIYDTIEFGDFQISCLSEHHSEDGGFAIRDLIIYHTPCKAERKVQHMQYISWPDHGVPAVHYEFIHFVDKVREFRSKHLEQIVVHCSAGIGRTGVLITMETAMCLIEANQPIDPVDILQKMRDQRASMIQTAAQFRFVCEAITKVYKDRETSSIS